MTRRWLTRLKAPFYFLSRIPYSSNICSCRDDIRHASNLPECKDFLDYGTAVPLSNLPNDSWSRFRPPSVSTNFQSNVFAPLMYPLVLGVYPGHKPNAGLQVRHLPYLLMCFCSVFLFYLLHCTSIASGLPFFFKFRFLIGISFFK